MMDGNVFSFAIHHVLFAYYIKNVLVMQGRANAEKANAALPDSRPEIGCLRASCRQLLSPENNIRLSDS